MVRVSYVNDLGRLEESQYVRRMLYFNAKMAASLLQLIQNTCNRSLVSMNGDQATSTPLPLVWYGSN